MKPTLWLLGLLAPTTSTASPALINIKSASLTRTNRGCAGGLADTTDPPQTEIFGTVQTVRSVNQLVAVPVLLRGTPNTAYSVRLIQTPNDNNCPQCLNGQTLTTNKAGIGYATVQQTVSPGATGAWVAINKKTDCYEFYTIPVLPIT
jgi:hypothetical protein